MPETIFAEATAPGRAGLSVIRVSGPGAIAAGLVLAPPALPARRAVLRSLRDPASGGVIDEALLIAFPGPGSFTGEDVLEIQCHGSRAVVRVVLERLGAVPGLRLAEPGEFTRRALENGRLDLAQVEGLADLVAAETEAQRRQAVAVMGGALSRLADGWRVALVEALALVEAAIDFADEDIPESVYAEAAERLAPVARELAAQVQGAPAAERLREGFEVALVGAPNAGKSTLLNAIAGRSVAITSEHPGTTRDVIELRVDLRGLPVTFLDLAGIRETEDPVEAEGVARARGRAAAADLRLVLGDFDEKRSQDGDLRVVTRADLGCSGGDVAVSGTTGLGVEALLDLVHRRLEDRVQGATLPAHARQAEALRRAAEAVERARSGLAGGVPEPERVAADLHLAGRALDFLVGRIDVEAVLDVTFQRFCLGK